MHKSGANPRSRAGALMHTPQGPVFVRHQGPADARPVLMLHALGTDMSLWDALADRLSATRRVIRIDAPGHGRSPAWPAVTLQQLATSVCAVLSQVAARPVDIVGTSMGAVVALQVAALAPEQVRRLVLVGALLVRADTAAQDMHGRAEAIARCGMTAMADTMIARWFPPRPDGDDTHAMGQLRAWMLQTDAQAYAACSDAFTAYDLSEALRARQPDCLLIAGALDGAIAEQFTQLHRQMPAITQVTMPDTGHFPHLQRPVEFDALVMDFLPAAD